jgi:hypothetical protein
MINPTKTDRKLKKLKKLKKQVFDEHGYGPEVSKIKSKMRKLKKRKQKS